MEYEDIVACAKTQLGVNCSVKRWMDFQYTHWPGHRQLDRECGQWNGAECALNDNAPERLPLGVDLPPDAMANNGIRIKCGTESGTVGMFLPVNLSHIGPVDLAVVLGP